SDLDAPHLGHALLVAIDGEQTDGWIRQIQSVQDEWIVCGRQNLGELICRYLTGNQPGEGLRETGMERLVEVVDGKDAGCPRVGDESEKEQDVESSFAGIVGRERVPLLPHEAVAKTEHRRRRLHGGR